MPERDPIERLSREVKGWTAPAAAAPIWTTPPSHAGARLAIALAGAVVAVGGGSALALAAPGPANQVPVRIVEMLTRITSEAEPVAAPAAAPSAEPAAPAAAALVPPAPAQPIQVVREAAPPASASDQAPAPARGEPARSDDSHPGSPRPGDGGVPGDHGRHSSDDHGGSKGKD